MPTYAQPTGGPMNKLILLTLSMMLVACSGIETIPEDTAAFRATGYTRYAWRSEPLEAGGRSNDDIYVVDKAVRAAFDERMAELGYSRTDRDNAQFMVEYLAAPGINDGLVGTLATNVQAVPSTTINRLPDGASVDNAYALGGVKTTGNVVLVFAEPGAPDLLWQVRISTLVENANRVDPAAVKKAIRQGLSTLPEAP